MRSETTGERLIVNHYQSSQEDLVIYLMHMAAYRFAEPFARGRKVLDFGCGSGYGAAGLAETASEVHGVDVSEEAITYAQRYFQRRNLDFERIEAGARLPFTNGSFGLVLSFQVLEHIKDIDHYLSEAQRLLEPNGYFILVTPDRTRRLLPLQRPWNRWHVFEYNERTLAGALGRYFESVEIQHMSGRPDVIGVELRRWRKLKWLTLPATLPLLPDSLRVFLLNGLHAIRRVAPSRAEIGTFSFDESSISIGYGLQPSLNLVAIARNNP